MEIIMTKRVFIAISRNHARIWAHGLEPHTKPEVIEEIPTKREYRKILNQFFNGRNRSTSTPSFTSKLYSQVREADEIFLVGAGKGKASALGNFVTHLRKYHPKVAERIRRIEKLDIEKMSDAELMASGRKMLLRP
jgi:hypothetical protein